MNYVSPDDLHAAAESAKDSFSAQAIGFYLICQAIADPPHLVYPCRDDSRFKSYNDVRKTYIPHFGQVFYRSLNHWSAALRPDERNANVYFEAIMLAYALMYKIQEALQSNVYYVVRKWNSRPTYVVKALEKELPVPPKEIPFLSFMKLPSLFSQHYLTGFTTAHCEVMCHPGFLCDNEWVGYECCCTPDMPDVALAPNSSLGCYLEELPTIRILPPCAVSTSAATSLSHPRRGWSSAPAAETDLAFSR